MENQTLEVVKTRKPRNRNVNTREIKRLHRQGLTLNQIADKLDLSRSTVCNHLGKKRKDACTVRVKSQVQAENLSEPTPIEFEANLFGTILKLDRTPLSIERIGNRIVIK